MNISFFQEPLMVYVVFATFLGCCTKIIFLIFMESSESVYRTMELILRKIDSSGSYALQDLSPNEEKAVALLLQFRAVLQATRMTPNLIFPGENFSEMVELGPKKYIHLAEKLRPRGMPKKWKVLNTNLLISGAVGAAIGGAIAGTLSWILNCG
ncbi:hypothetical protein LB465_06355 [Salegentibacter sp. LM13S]|uniref:hypothetical protein n=1 Tax=Salegentibacter lacus TaxID=2873599 RepID=UPI001CCF3540|nr:hypothetical protein [Salegentibacter lacus]MBZ9630397.1 hypothetical protein [Salegentibacter lacus]